MEDLVESLTRGNPTEVKVILASVVMGLAVYQLVLIAVGYGRVRPPFLQARPAARAHRAIGDALAALIVVIAIVVVTAQFGPTSAAEQEAREDRPKERIELREERQEQREEAREERLERGAGGGG
jgi:multisubunit Na+/H+ antiporter MnhC subunit